MKPDPKDKIIELLSNRVDKLESERQEMIQWAEDRIKFCDNIGGMELEKWAFRQCLRKLREQPQQALRNAGETEE